MARARTRRSNRRSKGRRISFKVPGNIRRAIAKAKTVVQTAIIVGEVQNGKVKLSSSQLKKVAGRKKSPAAAPDIVFVALNAPFKTKVLTGAA